MMNIYNIKNKVKALIVSALTLILLLVAITTAINYDLILGFEALIISIAFGYLSYITIIDIINYKKTEL